MKNLLKLISLISIMLFFNRCVENNTIPASRYTLEGIAYSQSIDGKLNAGITDSLGRIAITVEFRKNNRDQKMIKTFVKKNNGYYEQKLIGDQENKIVDTVFVLAFALQDTSVKYIYDYSKHPPAVPEGLDDWEYKISNQGNGIYKLQKQHLKDSSFVEEFIYDKSFRIKSINLFYGTDTLKLGE